MGALAVGGLGLIVVISFINHEEDYSDNKNLTVEELMNDISLPDGLPANVPMYPRAVLKNVQDVSDDDVRNVTLTLETSDSVDDVNSWYRGAMSRVPWAITSDRNVGGYILLRGENENVAVFTQAAKRSDIGVVVITQRIQIR